MRLHARCGVRPLYLGRLPKSRRRQGSSYSCKIVWEMKEIDDHSQTHRATPARRVGVRRTSVCERKREKEKKRKRERDRQTDRQTEKQTDRDRDRRGDKVKETVRDRERRTATERWGGRGMEGGTRVKMVQSGLTWRPGWCR